MAYAANAPLTASQLNFAIGATLTAVKFLTNAEPFTFDEYDSELRVLVPANTVWAAEIYAIYTGADTDNAVLGLIAPVGSSVTVSAYALDFAPSIATGVLDLSVQSGGNEAHMGIGTISISTKLGCAMSGFVSIGEISGLVWTEFWRSNASSSDPVTLYPGSWFKLTRIG